MEGTRGRNGWRRKEAIGKGRQVKEGAGESSVGTGWVHCVVSAGHKGPQGKGGEGERGEVCGRNVSSQELGIDVARLGVRVERGTAIPCSV